MNLNNKYLAIGLSVAAVVIVSYQLFVSKKDDNKGITRPNAPAYVATQPSGSPATTPATPVAPPAQTALAPENNTAGDQGPESEGGDSGPLIDYHSELLLKRIQPEMALPIPAREIAPDFGYPIFTKPVPKEEAPVSAGPVKEVELVLNGIIIDSNRRLAIINDTILKIGDVILGAQITAIVKNMVVLKSNQQEIILSTESKIQRLKLSGGKGDH